MELQDKIALDSKLLLDILENISTSVIVLNDDNSYFFVNIAGLDLLGISGKFPELSSLNSIIGHQHLLQHINSVRQERHSKMIRDFKFKNFEGHEKIVCSVAFSTDNKLVASGSSDYTIKLWDVRKFKIS